MSIVLDPHTFSISVVNLESIDPVIRPKYSSALQLETPSYKRIDPPWWQIELAIHSCHGEMDGGFGEFCVLSKLDSNSYVQTCVCLGKNVNERNDWRLEWRITDSNGTYTHYFAKNKNDKKDANTVENIEAVIMAFKSFYQNRVLPDSLTWKRIDI